MAKKKNESEGNANNEPRFAFKGGGYLGVDPQAVGRELAKLEIKPGDFHKTDDVLDAARPVDSPLHGCFTWGDEEAAEKCRRNEARRLLRNICYVIVREEKREKRPVYFHIRDAEGPKYVHVDRVASDAETRARALDEALTLLCGCRRRFDYLTELKPLFKALDNIIDAAKKKKDK